MDAEKLRKALDAAADTTEFVLGAGMLAKTPDVFQKHFPGQPAIVIADETTFAVAGRTIHDVLHAAGITGPDPFVFPAQPRLRADYDHVKTLVDVLQGTPAIPVAVGSGTINDLVKRAAYEGERPYMIVGTAASMDGYSSYGAALQNEGFKKTMECRAPLVILADTDILRDAPPEMTAAGYADLIGKVPAGADWLIADLVGMEPMQPLIWDMVHTDLRLWVGSPDRLTAGDREVFDALFEGLSMSGFAMQAMHNSRPASGADHLFSHIWEMQDLRGPDGLPVSHGFAVAIGALMSTALIETVFAKDIPGLDADALCSRWKPWNEREADIRTAFRQTPIIDRVIAESRAKYLTTDQLRDRLHLLIAHWEELKPKVLAQIIPYPQLRQMLEAAGCPVTPEQINLAPPDRVRDTFFQAQMIRDRYTILDLAYELGVLEECVDEIMASDVYLA